MTSHDNHDSVPVGHLRRLLVDAGVRGKWSLRELGDKAGAPAFSTWQRMVAPPAPPGKRGPKGYEDRVLRAAADTLRALGAEITYAQIKHAASADAGHVGYETSEYGDDPVEVALSYARQLSPADRMVFLQEFAAMAAADLGVPAPPRRARDQEDGVPDEPQNPHPQPG